MKSKHGIPQNELDRIVARDKDCVYCHKAMVEASATTKRGDWATIEHLNHIKEWDSVRSFIRDGKPIAEIVAICCQSCNSRRADRSLRDWFGSEYCVKNDINYGTVSSAVKKYIDTYEKTDSSK
ncbi:MAG: hypothetical protein EXS59_02745 [Candidatus Taylorbacteria bacterium]|nr:hypothetical protein [Candidatus Taylorbacteria bacterium]